MIAMQEPQAFKAPTTTEEAYEYFFRRRSGTIESLPNKLTRDLLQEFYSVRYAKQSVNGDWQETWMLTDFGKDQIHSYLILEKAIAALKA